MRTLTDHLVSYATYHRDARNIATHFIGIPTVVFSFTVLLSWPLMWVGDVPVSAAWGLWLVASLFYVSLSLPLGLLMTVLMAGYVALGAWVAHMGVWVWLAAGLTSFAVGWFFQLLGHHYERRKPAFVDDLVGLLVGPLFIVAEVLFAMGLMRPLQQTITAQAGPTRGS